MFGANSGGLVGTEHLICAMAYVDGTNVQNILQRVGFNKSDIQKIIQLNGQVVQPYFSPRTKNVLRNSVDLATQVGLNYVIPEHILAMILQESSSYAVRALVQLGCDINTLMLATTLIVVAMVVRNLILKESRKVA